MWPTTWVVHISILDLSSQRSPVSPIPGGRRTELEEQKMKHNVITEILERERTGKRDRKYENRRKAISGGEITEQKIISKGVLKERRRGG